MKKILIGVDDNKYAEHATAYGFNLARQLKAQIGLVHIIEPVAGPTTTTIDNTIGMPTDFAADYNAPELIEIQNEGSENLITRTIKKYGEGLDVAHFTDFGPTAEGIIECAESFGADLIIVGTHSRTGFDRLLMGSVAEHVVRHATVPVLVVPLPKEQEED